MIWLLLTIGIFLSNNSLADVVQDYGTHANVFICGTQVAECVECGSQEMGEYGKQQWQTCEMGSNDLSVELIEPTQYCGRWRGEVTRITGSPYITNIQPGIVMCQPGDEIPPEPPTECPDPGTPTYDDQGWQPVTEYDIETPVLPEAKCEDYCLAEPVIERRAYNSDWPDGVWVVWRYEYTGGVCTDYGASMPAPFADCQCDELTPGLLGCVCGAGEDCPSNAGICIEQEEPNCGTFNGTQVCLDDAPPGDCTMLPGGSYICDADAPDSSKPVDSDGDPEQPDYGFDNNVPDGTSSGGGGPAPGSGGVDVWDEGEEGEEPGPGDDPGDSEGSGDNQGEGESDTAQFCEDNPDSLICQKGEVSGNCGTPNGVGYQFNCKQDPVLCSIAENNFRQYCNHEREKDTATDLLNEIKKDNTFDGDPEEILKGRESTINLQDELNLQLTGSSWGNGQCPGDRTLVLLGKSVTFSFSAFCEVAVQLKPLLLVFATFFAGLIAYKIGFTGV
jgi:hypothetical protein